VDQGVGVPKMNSSAQMLRVVKQTMTNKNTSSIENFDTVAVYEYLVIQNMLYCIPYPNKCVCSHQNCEAASILSGDITVLRF